MSTGEHDATEGEPDLAATQVRLSDEVQGFQKILGGVARQIEQQGTVFEQISEVSRQHRETFRALDRQLQQTFAPVQELAAQIAKQQTAFRNSAEVIQKAVDQVVRPAVLDFDQLHAALSVRPLDFAKAFRKMQVNVEPLLNVAFRPAAATPGGPSAAELSTGFMDDFEAVATEEPDSGLVEVTKDALIRVVDGLDPKLIVAIQLALTVTGVVLGLASLMVTLYGSPNQSRPPDGMKAVEARRSASVATPDTLTEWRGVQIECPPIDSAGEQPAPERPGSDVETSPPGTEPRRTGWPKGWR